ncbi:MAG: DUF58 domain-containing protein [Anaerolineae bacterium]
MHQPIERRLELKTRLPLVIIALLAFNELVSPARIWASLLVGTAGVTLVAFLWARQMRDHVTLRRVTRGTWVTVGDVVSEQFELVNDALVPVLWAEVVDLSTVPGYNASQVVACDAQSSYAWQTKGTCRRRGVYTLGPTEVSLGDPFGFFRVVQRYGDVETILVYPKVMRLPALQLPRGAAIGRTRSTLRAQERTLLAATVREYQPGDSLSRIHWRSSAHRGELMVKEFDRELSGNLWIVLDLDESVHVGSGEESTLEYGVILAASLAAQHLQSGERRSVGLVAFGAEEALLVPHAGQEQLWRILRALAAAQASSHWSLERVLAAAEPSMERGQTIIVITPSTDPAWISPLLPLKQKGLSPAVLLIDPGSFNGREPHEDRVMGLRGLLAEHGIVSHVIQQGFPFEPMIRQVRRRVEYRVLGTGRVVPVVVEEEV